MQNNYDYEVIIIGGGVSGISCGLVIGSAEQKDFAQNKKTLIFDSRKSDVYKGRFFNAIGIEPGLPGSKVLKQNIEQLKQYESITYQLTPVKKVVEDSEKFEVTDAKDNRYTSKYLVLATGFREFDINGLDLPLEHYSKSENPDRVMVKNDNYKVRERLYACGLFAGDSSQYPIVAGSGANVAVQIISDWAGKHTIIHDKISDK